MSDTLTPDRVARLQQHLGVRHPFAPFARGSVFVGHSGDVVLKLFPADEAEYAATERGALEALAGALPVQTPAVKAAGVFEDHPYVLMSRLQGEELLELWPTLAATERADLGRQLGELVVCLNRVTPPPALTRPDWGQWCREKKAEAVAVQSRLKAPANLVAGLPRYLAGLDLSEGPLGSGFLHTEIMRDHLLVQPTARGPRLSGLFDFEPATVLPLDYELASIGLFFSGGEPEVLRAVLEGMGRDPHAPGLTRRLMGMFLMHRYCSFGFALRRTGSDPALGLDGLASAWFGAGQPEQRLADRP